ncbi:MAG TPA: penicillin-binding protein 1C [Chloroflexi bacterium]|nr:penicillin-binding protein 1C [Chloroflexota bacterium]
MAFLRTTYAALPSADAVRSRAMAPSSLILARDGRVLYEIIDPHAGPHRPLPLDEMPEALWQGIVATEDATFFQNPGFDPMAIARALWTNLRYGEIRSGASTITQQLARNLLMSAEERYEQTWTRKLREAILAIHMTRSLSKEEILALYLNETYFGNLAYGVEAAARGYFGKPVAELDLAECALLAGLPQSPEGYNPLTNLEAAKARQKVVLGLMVKAGYITRDEAELATREPLHLASGYMDIEAPHFSMLVREQLAALLGEETVMRGGLRVRTTLDLDVQRAAEAQVRFHLARLNEESDSHPGHNVRNAAVVVIDHADGAVVAMVGSPDYYDARSDGAVNAAMALRQPGSALKPFTYAAAFAQGLTPATMMTDVETAFVTREGEPYVPVNYDYRFHGPVLLRQALACSYNVVAVKVLEQIGIPALTSLTTRLGITSLGQADSSGLALTLGSGEVRLLELTAAYGGFATGGLRVRPYLIDEVTTADGTVLYQALTPPRERVMDERIAYLITDILSDPKARAPAFGEGSALDAGLPAAVKTGTTTEWRDNWTVGYTTRYVVGVWVGNADNEPMRGISGVDGAAPIWRGVIRALHPTAPPGFSRPDGLVEIEVCAESGQLPGAACTHRRRELFLQENVPTETCTLHGFITVDIATGEPAGEDTPPEQRLVRRVTYWPADALAWVQEQGLPLPPPQAPVHTEEGQNALPAQAKQAGVASAPGTEAPLFLSKPPPNSRFALTAEIPADKQRIEIIGSSSAGAHLREVTLYVDGTAWHAWTHPPYRTLWPLAPGVHEFVLQGVDPQGNAVSSPPVRISVHSEPSRERTSP